MTAQTSRAAEEYPPITEQVTPVIIKFAGGGADALSDVSNTVSIDSIMPFREAVPGGHTWESSESSLTGRITELSIKDGAIGPIVDYPIIPSKDLASVVISCGDTRLTFRECGDPAGNNVILLIKSSVPFTVRDFSGADWTDSSATLRNKITAVVFRVGNDVIADYKLLNADVSLNITFYRDKAQ